MRRWRSFDRAFPLLLVLTAGSLQAQQLVFDPPNPRPDQKVVITYSIFATGCGTVPLVSVQPPAEGNGQIVLGAASSNCGPPSLQTLTVTVGPLPLGTYVVRVLTLEDPVPAKLVVSRTGAIVHLTIEPVRPVAGLPVTVGFDTFCPLVLKPPRIQPAENETLILLDQDPESPQPAAPCFSQPSWAYRFPLGPLPPGTYRLRVRMGPSSAMLETEAEAVFSVEPARPALALRQERFRVWADWSAPGFGQGSAQGVLLTDESGYFTFFGPSNLELIVKVLNGCPVNRRYWVFLAGLTNVGVVLHVEDTATGRLETYVNPSGKVFQPVLDTSSFATCP